MVILESNEGKLCLYLVGVTNHGVCLYGDYNKVTLITGSLFRMCCSFFNISCLMMLKGVHIHICHAMEEANAMKEILQLYTIQGIV